MASPFPSNNSQQIASTSKIYISSSTRDQSSSNTNSNAEISKDEPVSPPPPSRKDSDTAQIVDAELAMRLNKGGWKRLSLSHSPLTPMTPHFRRTKTPVTPENPETAEQGRREGNASTGEAGAGAGAEAGGENVQPPKGVEEERSREKSRLKKRAMVQRRATDASGSVELDGLARVDTRLAMQKLGGQKALYRYVDVYENQRGWARLGSFKFSSRALNLFFHYNDPAPFTKYEVTDHGLEEVDLPYSSLSDIQLPSADWSWHSPEWMIDMAGDGITSYDGFQYNAHFRPKGWSPIAPKWHSYLVTCVRRRRWLRLMVYLPSLSAALPDKEGKYHSPGRHIPTASEPTSASRWPGGYSPGNTPTVAEPGQRGGDDDDLPHSPGARGSQLDTQEVWRGNANDWSRCHAALRTLRSDGRRLELWKAWTGDLGEESEEVDLTGMGRLSLERKRATGEDDPSNSKLAVLKEDDDKEDPDQARSKKEKGKWARGVRWTEDVMFGRGSTLRMTREGGEQEERRVISQFMTDEPLEVDSSRAPKEFIANVLKYHAQEILALFIYPDSRTKFHDILQRTGLLEAIPNDVSFTYSTDFRERVEV